MKRSMLAIIPLSFLLLASCQRDKDDLREQTKIKILGKWRLDKAVEEEYKPVNTLISSDEEHGLPGDSVVFRADGIAMTYSDIYGPEEIAYEVSNNSTIILDDENYKIGKLTDTEFYLYQEETDLSAGEKWVYKIYLIR